MIEMIAKNLDDAWLRVNRRFLGADGDNERPEDACRALMCYSFNNVIQVNAQPIVTLDPGILVNYDKAKWRHLLRTYMDWAQYDWLRKHVKFRFERSNDNVIPLGYTFKPSLKSNGSCLVGYTFLIDKKNGRINMSMHTRVAEVTRRMMMDYIYLYRMWEGLFGELEVWDYEWTITLFYEMMYQSAMFAPILHTTFNFDEIGISTKGRKHTGFLGRVEKEIEVCMKTESKGSGFAQMKKIRDLIAKDMQGVPRKSIPMDYMQLEPFRPGQDKKK